MKYLAVVLTTIICSSSAFCQNPMDMYNRRSQPLSPYLNLLRGGNVAANYYYGARPGLPAGGYRQNTPMGSNTAFAPRQSYFENALPLGVASSPLAAGQIVPTGHPTGFFATLGYFPATTARQATLGIPSQR
ncbi:MAG: hypothetical protein R3B84_04865 [Zavarzinella sp.]